MDQIIYGIISGFAVLIFVSAGRIIHVKWKNRALSTFWQFLNSKVYVVLPAYSGPKGEQLPQNLARIEDVIATEFLISILRSRDIEYRVVDHFEAIPSDVDEILLCSPKGNQRSTLFMKQVDLPYEFQMDEQATPYFVDKATGVKYRSPSDTQKFNVDFALVGRYTDKKASKRVFILWGIHGVGTLAAVKFAMDRKQVSSLNKIIGKDDFVALIQGDYSSPRLVGDCEIAGPVRRIPHNIATPVQQEPRQ